MGVRVSITGDGLTFDIDAFKRKHFFCLISDGFGLFLDAEHLCNLSPFSLFLPYCLRSVVSIITIILLLLFSNIRKTQQEMMSGRRKVRLINLFLKRIKVYQGQGIKVTQSSHQGI